jgi:hypothetical protein
MLKKIAGGYGFCLSIRRIAPYWPTLRPSVGETIFIKRHARLPYPQAMVKNDPKKRTPITG